MLKKSLTSFFEDFLYKESLFIDRGVLLTAYTPDKVYHRDKEINKIANILAPAIKQQKPSNLFVYGNTGTGKTLSIQYVREEMLRRAKKNTLPLDKVISDRLIEAQIISARNKVLRRSHISQQN